MPSPLDTTELDLYGQPQSEAAKRASARAAAIRGQQFAGLAGMLSASPGLQKAGEGIFGESGKELGNVQDVAGNVLTHTLAKERNDIARVQAERELAQLALQNKQFAELVRQQGFGNVLQAYQAYLSGQKTPPTNLLAEEAKLGEQIAGTKSGILGSFLPGLANLLNRAPEARKAEVERLIKESGGRTQAPLSVMDFAKQMGVGGATPPTPANIAGVKEQTPAQSQAALAAPQPDANGHIWVRRGGQVGKIGVNKFNPQTDEVVSPP